MFDSKLQIMFDYLRLGIELAKQPHRFAKIEGNNGADETLCTYLYRGCLLALFTSTFCFNNPVLCAFQLVTAPRTNKRNSNTIYTGTMYSLRKALLMWSKAGRRCPGLRLIF